MNVNQQHYRTIWPDPRCKYVEVIDQTTLPFDFKIARIHSLEMMIEAIATMQVRGAPLIGASAAYGMALAMLEDESDDYLMQSAEKLIAARPTAVNLSWAVNRMVEILKPVKLTRRNFTAWQEAAHIAEEDVKQNQMIGQHGLALIQQAINDSKSQNKTFNILTHCNAGWLATVDYGTALSPVFAAHDAGLNVHVWVDETRPRNQGASLTAWELAEHGVLHTVISDNAGGHLMQKGLVDMVLVGADRVTRQGDVCNKIGTYLKALAAHDNQIPFYAAVPNTTIDWEILARNIDIEHRNPDEVTYMSGLNAQGKLESVRVMPKASQALNPAFDITRANLVTGIITESGIFSPGDLHKAAPN